MDVESVEVVVGRIGRAHGIRGDVTIDVRTDEPDRRFVVGAVLRAQSPPAQSPRGSAGTSGTSAQLTVSAVRWHSSKLLVTFAEIPDRTAAEAARGTLLHVDIPLGESPDDPDEFYDHQLVGLAVHDLDGALLGEVTGLVHGGAQDLLAVRTPDGRDALVPFVTALVPEVDLPGGRVVVADRPGLVTPLDET